MDFLRLWTILSANGIVLTHEQIIQLERFSDELLYWNKKINLISRKDEENLLTRHIIHSLTPLKYVNLQHNSNCLDIGTGGGLPGIPLAIARHDIRMLLVDSIGKKIKTAEMFAKHTTLRTIKAVNSRVELLAEQSEYAGKFDYAFSRAVANVDVVLFWIDKLMKPGAKVIFYKGGDLSQEINIANDAFPWVTIKEIPIEILGDLEELRWFVKDEKKLLVCEFEK